MARTKNIQEGRTGVNLSVDAKLAERIEEIRWSQRIPSLNAVYVEVLESGVDAVEKKYGVTHKKEKAI